LGFSLLFSIMHHVGVQGCRVIDVRTAQEFEPDRKAAEEIESLYTWLCGIQVRKAEQPRRSRPKGDATREYIQAAFGTVFLAAPERARGSRGVHTQGRREGQS
jgi:hypothetical protein